MDGSIARSNPRKGKNMTQDEIIEMAIQGHAGTRDAIRWAINQVVKAEREECAKLFETIFKDPAVWPVHFSSSDTAKLIRARGAK
jgi:hypothetical protein